MRVIIIEDEIPAADRLTTLLNNINIQNDIEIVARLDSIESSVNFLPTASEIDLIFMDIQLADGLSFYIFQKLNLSTPVIFTTAFDQYTLKAFKVNSLDYLLKPIDENELANAVEKYHRWYPRTNKGLSEKIEKLAAEMNTTARYKERILIKRGRQLHYLKTDETAYFFADGKLCYAIDFNGNRFLVEYTLNQLTDCLAPNRFYRISRHLFVNIDSVKKIHPWMGGRLQLELLPPVKADTTVSRERVNGFKDWLGQ
ncbi:LytR/AlgR family response regulator transcription factor [Flavitalea flava]